MKKPAVLLIVIVSVILTASACGSGLPTPSVPEAAPTPGLAQEKGDEVMSLQLISTAFAARQPIPARYSCLGQDVSPPLAWADPPQGTQGFALIADDPDAPVGIWVHWVLYNLPAGSRELPEVAPLDEKLGDGSLNGQNSWGRVGYGGPCPPAGTHRYFFRLYALDTQLDLPAGKDKKQVLKAMEGHILAQAELMGTFTRP